MPALSQLLAAKLEQESLTTTAAAEKAGVSFPSFAAVLKGQSVPNARSIDKYAAFLGVSVDEVREAAKSAASSRGAGGGDKPKRGPGRPVGGGRGRARKTVGGAIDATGALREVEAALVRANEVLGDELAMRVHDLSPKGRGVIQALLASLD